jgi:hypothetical protein
MKKKPGDHSIFQDIMAVSQLDPGDLASSQGPNLPEIIPSSKIKPSFYSTAVEGRKSERGGSSNFASNAAEYFRFQKGLRQQMLYPYV